MNARRVVGAKDKSRAYADSRVASTTTRTTTGEKQRSARATTRQRRGSRSINILGPRSWPRGRQRWRQQRQQRRGCIAHVLHRGRSHSVPTTAAGMFYDAIDHAGSARWAGCVRQLVQFIPQSRQCCQRLHRSSLKRASSS